nr:MULTISPECIES: 3'-5' exonuclease KapD [Bacillus]
MVEQKTVLVVDFEFTMPDGKYHPQNFFPEIIEAGVVKAADETIIDTFSSYVKPKKFPKLTKRCKSFLGITQEDVESGISFEEFIEKLVSLDGGENCEIITWGNMDMKVLKQNCMLNHIAFPFKGKLRDLAFEYKTFFGDRTLTGLRKAAKEYGSEGAGKHHKALDDAMTTYQLLTLFEKDRAYVENPQTTKIGELIDFSHFFDSAD